MIWEWSPDYEKGFKGVKYLFCLQMLLHYPDMTKPFFLQTDASDFALRTVLYQENPEKGIQPVSYASRTLKEAEINYFTTEKELLAIVWALMKCRSYLFGLNFVIRTDHEAFFSSIFLRSCKLIGSRLTRWILSIQDYNFRTEHCAGKHHIVAETLSRIPLIQEGIANPIIDECHELYGHGSPLKCMRMLSETFHYPRFAKVIRKRIASCKSCQVNKVTNQTCYSEIRSLAPSKPRELLSIDFYGSLPATKGGFQYILFTIDSFRKFVKLYTLRITTTKAEILKLSNDYFPKYGKPERIICDHGTQFISKKWLDTMAREGI